MSVQFFFALFFFIVVFKFVIGVLSFLLLFGVFFLSLFSVLSNTYVGPIVPARNP